MKVKLVLHHPLKESEVFWFDTKEEAGRFISEYTWECLLDKNFLSVEYTIVVL